MLTTNVRRVDNLRDPERPWSLQWRTENMSASAFWYFATEDEARNAERDLREQRQHQKDLR